MKRVGHIGKLLKKIYRLYSSDLLLLLQDKGFVDLRPSFLEILLFLCDYSGPSIKEVGKSCGLKKQTMTSHLNELEKRGYIKRKQNPDDKREQNVFLTEYGEKFKLSLMESINKIEQDYVKYVGDLELDRVEMHLKNFHDRITLKK